MKDETKSSKPSSQVTKPKSNLKAAYGKYESIIVEKGDCWEKDLKKTIRLLNYSALIAVSLLLSCSKKVPEPDCGCESKQIGFLAETKAQYKGDGIFIVYDSGQYQKLSVYTVCEINSSWKKSGTEVYDYKISGYYKKQCIEPDIIPLFTDNPLEISSIVVPR